MAIPSSSGTRSAQRCTRPHRVSRGRAVRRASSVSRKCSFFSRKGTNPKSFNLQLLGVRSDVQPSWPFLPAPSSRCLTGFQHRLLTQNIVNVAVSKQLCKFRCFGLQADTFHRCTFVLGRAQKFLRKRLRSARFRRRPRLIIPLFVVVQQLVLPASSFPWQQKLERKRHVVFLRRNRDDSADDSGHVSDRDHRSDVKRCLGDFNDLEIRSCSVTIRYADNCKKRGKKKKETVQNAASKRVAHTNLDTKWPRELL